MLVGKPEGARGKERSPGVFQVRRERCEASWWIGNKKEPSPGRESLALGGSREPGVGGAAALNTGFGVGVLIPRG